MYDPDFLHPIFTLSFPCWSVCGYLCWVWLWILCMTPLIIKAALLIREKSRRFIALTVLKYEFKVKHWFTFALLKLFEFSIKSASKFSNLGEWNDYFQLKNRYVWGALVLLPPAAVVGCVLSCGADSYLGSRQDKHGQIRVKMTTNTRPAVKITAQRKTDKKKTTYLPEPPLQMNPTSSSLTICTWIVLYEAWLSPFLTPLLSPVPFDVPCCLYKINNDLVKTSRISLHLDCISWSWVLIKKLVSLMLKPDLHTHGCPQWLRRAAKRGSVEANSVNANLQMQESSAHAY